MLDMRHTSDYAARGWIDTSRLTKGQEKEKEEGSRSRNARDK